MIIYNYDADGFFTGESEADESPLEPGVYLIPALATATAPPLFDEGMRAIFNGQTWDGLPIPAQPALTQEQLIRKYESALDTHLDSVAQLHRYRDRVTFALRSGYPGPYQAEGIAFGSWMDDCNAQAFAQLGRVVDGIEAMPTLEAFIASLPIFVLP